MKKINQYIDRCLVDEYATKSFKDGYSLDLDEIPESDLENFLRLLMTNDTTVRDLVRCHMQQLINNRLQDVESEDFDALKWRKTA